MPTVLSFSVISILKCQGRLVSTLRSRSSSICVKVFYACLGVTGTGSIRNETEKKWCVPTETLTVVDLFERHVVVRDTFSPLARALPSTSTKKLAMSLSSAVAGGQYDTKHVAFE